MMDLRESTPSFHDNNDDDDGDDDGDGEELFGEDVDIDAITKDNDDLTFLESRLVVTDMNGVLRVTSYNNLVNIDLTFSGETPSLDNNPNEDAVSKTDAGNGANNIPIEKHKQSCSDGENENDSVNVSDDFDFDDGSQSFDCANFFVILRSLNAQKSKRINNSKGLPRTTNTCHFDQREDGCTTLKRDNDSDLARLQQNFNNWTAEDWGMELSDMVGDTSCDTRCTPAAFLDFDKLKTVDVWRQLSHYIKSKIRI